MDKQRRKRLENRVTHLNRHIGSLAEEHLDALAALWVGVEDWEAMEKRKKTKAEGYAALLKGLPNAEEIAKAWRTRQEKPSDSEAERRLRIAVQIAKIHQEGGVPGGTDLFLKESIPVAKHVRRQIEFQLQRRGLEVQSEVGRFRKGEQILVEPEIIEGTCQIIPNGSLGNETKG